MGPAARAFDLDLAHCSKSGDKLKIIAAIVEQAVIARTSVTNGVMSVDGVHPSQAAIAFVSPEPTESGGFV